VETTNLETNSGQNSRGRLVTFRSRNFVNQQ